MRKNPIFLGIVLLVTIVCVTVMTLSFTGSNILSYEETTKYNCFINFGGRQK
jgi:hypothetical protein